MPVIDFEANSVYDLLLRGFTLFRKCVDSKCNGMHCCTMCGNTLEYAYMENRLYALRCQKCKTVTLIRASCVSEAADVVGYWEELENDDDVDD